MSGPLPTLPRLAAALPAVFLLHVAEEAPGFVPWFNILVTPPISHRLFLSVNVLAFLITLAAAYFVVTSRDRASALAGVAWVGFLMLANAAFHVVATVVLGRYCPGVITALLLYVPVSVLFLRAAARERGLSAPSVLAVAVLGGVPMDLHGYLIVFRGSRLF